MVVTLYGIKNFGTVKKARAWLEERGIEYAFHDYKVAGVDRDCLANWCREFGWEHVLNRSGTSFRKLPDADKTALDAERARALMLVQPSLIKRPILDLGGERLLGFDAERYRTAFGTIA